MIVSNRNRYLERIPERLYRVRSSRSRSSVDIDNRGRESSGIVHGQYRRTISTILAGLKSLRETVILVLWVELPSRRGVFNLLVLVNGPDGLVYDGMVGR